MKEKNKVFLFILVAILFSSCNPDRIFEEYQGMPDLKWALEDTVSFDLSEVDPNTAYSAVGIKYNDTYEFRNLYIRYILTDSAEREIADSLINVPLFDSKTGRPLGRGFGNVYTKYDTLPQLLNTAGTNVRVKFIQYMRKEELKGIESVGLRINRN